MPSAWPTFNARGRGAKENKDDRIDADAASERLRTGALKPVFHGAAETLTLRELVRNYENLVEDATRVMARIKAVFRARGIGTPGVSVYGGAKRRSGWRSWPAARECARQRC